VPADAQGRIQGALSSLVSLVGDLRAGGFAGALVLHGRMHRWLPGIAFLTQR
jgi:hypothetical protein